MNEIKSVCDITIFGGHGDLAFRKLMPALYHLSNNGYLDEKSRVITATRDSMTHEEHCEYGENEITRVFTRERF